MKMILDPCLSHISVATCILLVMSCEVLPTLSHDHYLTPCNLTITREPGRCLWYKQCMEYDVYVPGAMLNCFDNNPAREVADLGENFRRLLKEVCPQMLERGRVCCDTDMLITLRSQMQYPRQLFSRCPACLKNFVDHFCLTTCDPDQSLYFNPTSCLTGRDSRGEWFVAVADVTVYVNEQYAEDLFNSCKNVKYPQEDSDVIDVMCGGSDECNSHLWLQYLGDPTQNHNSPFVIKYKFVPSGSKPPLPGVKPKKQDVIHCNTSDTAYHCGYTDCHTPKNCSIPPHTPKQLPHSVMLNFTAVYTDTYATFAPVGVYGVNWTFGPVLTNSVLYEVFDIQEHLIKMEAPGTLDNGEEVMMSLNDICSKPFDTTPFPQNCAIISVLNYFQNNRTRLMHTEYFGLLNNSYQIHYCTRDPNSPTGKFMRFPCIAEFGGPVNPNDILGGFNYWPNCAPNYQNATSLIVSFLLDSQEDFNMIKIWEKGFLDYMATPNLTKYTHVSFSIDNNY